MNGPEYIAPANLGDALRIKHERGAQARVIAGGTDLILRMRDKVLAPDLLIDLKNVSLDTISDSDNGIRLGACVTCREFAGPPIRNRGTLGGNLVNASPAADLVPPLLAYDANLVLASSSAVRELPLTGFFTGPGQTVMAPDEILTEVRLPSMPAPTASVFIKLGQRRSMAISIVNLAIRLTLDDASRVSAARIVLGAVAPTPIRAGASEALLTGQELSGELIALAAKKASRETSAITDVRASKEYREKMTRVLVRRALESIRDELQRSESSG
jgi:carbon-monoxide dehydrogenase medium subunit